MIRALMKQLQIVHFSITATAVVIQSSYIISSNFASTSSSGAFFFFLFYIGRNVFSDWSEITTYAKSII